MLTGAVGKASRSEVGTGHRHATLSLSLLCNNPWNKFKTLGQMPDVAFTLKYIVRRLKVLFDGDENSFLIFRNRSCGNRNLFCSFGETLPVFEEWLSVVIQVAPNSLHTLHFWPVQWSVWNLMTSFYAKIMDHPRSPLKTKLALVIPKKMHILPIYASPIYQNGKYLYLSEVIECFFPNMLGLRWKLPVSQIMQYPLKLERVNIGEI